MRHEPGSLIDGYRVIEGLGEGAYAETYRAEDTSSGRTVVLKVPNPSLLADPGVFQRFSREREIASRLDHPNVQRSMDLARHRSEPYLVLEYVDGVSMRTRIRELRSGRHGAVPLDTALDWGRQLASVIAYLHTQGIVHRDMKPENILITPDDRVKLIDFGTALLEGAKRLTWKHLTDGLGTPSYMSPEQIQGERGDDRSDIYAWGVMMYELLTGDVPFGGDNWLAVMAGHLTAHPAPIRARNPQVSPQLEAVVLTAMRRHPEHRYQDAADLVRDLDRLDELDVSSFDLRPESAMGGVAAVDSEKRLWLFVVAVAAAFIGVVAVIIAISIVVGNR